MDCYYYYSPNNKEIENNFIRGPAVEKPEDDPHFIDYSFLSTVDLRRYFPMLKRIKTYNEGSEAYKVVDCCEPLCEHILQERWEFFLFFDTFQFKSDSNKKVCILTALSEKEIAPVFEQWILRQASLLRLQSLLEEKWDIMTFVNLSIKKDLIR